MDNLLGTFAARFAVFRKRRAGKNPAEGRRVPGRVPAFIARRFLASVLRNKARTRGGAGFSRGSCRRPDGSRRRSMPHFARLQRGGRSMTVMDGDGSLAWFSLRSE